MKRGAQMSNRSPIERTGEPINIRLCRPDEAPTIRAIINAAAERYRGVIPGDCWHDPYFSETQLSAELEAGVEFWGVESDGELIGVMGVQPSGDVHLIRHAYVLPARQGSGIGTVLLRHLRERTPGPMLIGTWAAATWAIDFYTRHGFRLVPPEETAALLSTYWTISQRQIETSVVLTDSAN